MSDADAPPPVERNPGEAAGGNGDGEEGTATGPDGKDGNQSDDSVQIIEPPDPVVIDVDELDSEESRDPAGSVGPGISSAGARTSQQKEPER